MEYGMGSSVAANTEFTVDDIYSIVEKTFQPNGYYFG
jgi:hypothetical protein